MVYVCTKNAASEKSQPLNSNGGNVMQLCMGEIVGLSKVLETQLKYNYVV